MNTKKLVISSMLAGILSILSPVSINIGIVPITLSTLVIFIIASLNDLKTALFAVTSYIMLGIFGLPVFSGFEGGLQKLFSVSGGYILSYIPITVIISFVLNKKNKKICHYALAYILATFVCYAFGTLWGVFIFKIPFDKAVLTFVLPFLTGDLLKIILSVIAVQKLKKCSKWCP